MKKYEGVGFFKRDYKSDRGFLESFNITEGCQENSATPPPSSPNRFPWGSVPSLVTWDPRAGAVLVGEEGDQAPASLP